MAWRRSAPRMELRPCSSLLSLAWFSALSRFNDGEVHGNREKDVPAFGRDFDGIGAGVDLLAQWGRSQLLKAADHVVEGGLITGRFVSFGVRLVNLTADHMEEISRHVGSCSPVGELRMPIVAPLWPALLIYHRCRVRRGWYRRHY